MSGQSELDRLLRDEFGFKPSEPRHINLETATTAFLHQHQGQLRPIQEQAIGLIHGGSNALLLSSTASGKTEGALIPIAAHLLANRGQSTALYLAPTRALLNDLLKRLAPPLHRLNLRYAIRHGDRPLRRTAETLDILFTTPESLDVLLVKDTPFLSRVTHVIVDEIHQVFGTPRGAQVLFLLERLKKKSGQSLQRIALSATVGDSAALAAWFRSEDSPVEIVQTSHSRAIVPDLHWLDHPESLRPIIRTSGARKILIFVNSRRVCDDVFLLLTDFAPYEMFVHYSSLTRMQREYVESRFKESEYAICVATTTLELGIDIGSIESVLLFEPPYSVSSFLHRIGRGGRRTDVTHAVMTPRQDLDLLQFCAATVLGSRGQVEVIQPGEFYSALIQQIFSCVAAKHHHRIHEEEIVELCVPWPWITREDVHAILQNLSRQGYLRYERPWHSYEMAPKLQVLYNKARIYSNIADRDSGIPVFHQGRLLARLPLPMAQVRIGNTILFAGRHWIVTAIGDSGITVRLGKPVPNPVRPVWGGLKRFSVNGLLADTMKRILVQRLSFAEFKLDDMSGSRLDTLHSRMPRSADAHQVWEEHKDDTHIYYTFAGAIENLIMRLLFEAAGYPCRCSRDADGIALVADRPLHFSSIPDDTENIEDIMVAHWQVFAAWTNHGPHYDLLPRVLKKREVLSQILDQRTLSRVQAYHGIEVVPGSLGLVSR